MFYMSKFCLLCLKADDGDLEYVEHKDLNDVTIQEKLDYCIFELISSGAELPGYVCRHCLDMTEKFYNFKQCCFKNNVKVKNLMDSLKQMKFSAVSYRNLSVEVEDISKNNLIYSLNKNKLKTPKKEDITKKEIKKEKNVNQYTPIKYTSKLYECSVCQKMYSSVSQLNKHLKVHASYDCNICLKKFAQEDNLIAHKKTHVKNTSTPKSNSSHKRYLKTINGPHYLCNTCNTPIMHKHNMKRHMREVHKKSKFEDAFTYVKPTGQTDIVDLTIDDDEFDSGIALNIDNDVIELKDEIEEQVSDREMYNEILESKSPKKTAVNNLDIQKEVNDKSLNVGKDNLACFVCDKLFTRSCTLNAHISSHFNETPYSVNKQLKM